MGQFGAQKSTFVIIALNLCENFYAKSLILMDAGVNLCERPRPRTR